MTQQQPSAVPQVAAVQPQIQIQPGIGLVPVVPQNVTQPQVSHGFLSTQNQTLAAIQAQLTGTQAFVPVSTVQLQALAAQQQAVAVSGNLF